MGAVPRPGAFDGCRDAEGPARIGEGSDIFFPGPLVEINR
jgi:hypothetical protein